MLSRRVTFMLLITATVLCAACAQGTQAVPPAPVKDLVAKMPTQTPSETRDVCAGIVAHGEAGIVELCGRLVPPGTGFDTQTRYAVEGVVTHVSRPGAESERKMVARALISALNKAPDKEVQAFLIEETGRIGGKETIAPLSRYLQDSRLCDPAVAAMVSIGGPAASKALKAALPSAQGRNRVAVTQALETLRAKEAPAKTPPRPAESQSQSRARGDVVSAPERNLCQAAPASDSAGVQSPPEGFVALFNGKDLTGWKGLLAGPLDNPIRRSRASTETLATAQVEADKDMKAHWQAENGILVFDGKGRSICTGRDYGDFEMLVDWRIPPGGDSGIYLRGSPQVQIWDPANPAAAVGSGGLYNNKKNPSKPLKCADKPVGEWNTFRIKMVGDRVTVHLNGELVTDNVVLENYWDYSRPMFPIGQIELQNHGAPLYFRNIFIREIPRKGEWRPLFNGRDLAGWTGDTRGYVPENGNLVCRPGGNVYTEQEFADFRLSFEFKLTPGANNGLGIRAPLTGDAAYVGMEIQILDDSADQYRNLKPYQYHGSIYGVVPAKRGFQKPVGEWNTEEVIAKGKHITVMLNGTAIVDADIDKALTPATMDQHPGLKREKGHIGFLGHDSVVWFRNIRIMEKPE